MNGSTVYVCLRAGRRAGRDPRRNSTQHKDRLSAAAVTHGERIKIYMRAAAIQESAAAVELQGKCEQDICLSLASPPPEYPMTKPEAFILKRQH